MDWSIHYGYLYGIIDANNVCYFLCYENLNLLRWSGCLCSDVEQTVFKLVLSLNF